MRCHKVAKKIAKPQPIIKLTIQHGLASPAQKEAYRCFWKKIIAEVKSQQDSNHEQEK